jgi:phage terminase large subunit-like protein
MPDLSRLPGLLKKLEWQLAGNKIQAYKPYDWQKEFHAAGINHPERMLMAANRVGKTMSAAAEVSYHLTGDYPVWWEGKRFLVPTLVWTGSPTNETSRDIVQTELLGGLGEKLGTGAVPRKFLEGTPKTRQAGVKDVVDSFNVRHKSGGLSFCTMKTYEQGWEKWQGTAPHVVWMDEEPSDYKIFSEAQTRILTSKGIALVTFTPLQGMTDLVQHFIDMAGIKDSGVYVKGATWDDAPHLSKVDKDRLSASYRGHEREARTKGVPMMGEGAVFPIGDDEISFNVAKQWPNGIPGHYARIKGCDFGMDHPAAGVECAWDRDADIFYVIDCYRKPGETAPYHAAWLNKSSRWVPVAWPHDGMNREKSGGKTLADSYRQLNVNMLSKSARYPKVPGEQSDKGGGQPVEPIVEEMLQRMGTGRLKVADHLSQWFEEKRSYHRKDGKIVDRRDDILKATMYALMMKRYAVTSGSLAATIRMPTSPIATTRI